MVLASPNEYLANMHFLCYTKPLRNTDGRACLMAGEESPGFTGQGAR